MKEIQQIFDFLLTGPRVTQVFVLVFLMYLAWALSQHLWIGFWIAIFAAAAYQYWSAKGPLLTSSATPAAATDDNDADDSFQAGLRRLPELLLRHVTATMLPLGIRS